MDTDAEPGEIAEPDAGPEPEESGEETPVARHYTTGRLTTAQARVLNGWRCQLTTVDRRWDSTGGRAPASSSDCLAAAVIDLLDHAEPDHIELIRYADRLRTTMAARRGRAAPAVSVASFYLTGTYATRLDDLLAAAREHHIALLDAAREQVETELPATERVMRMMSAVALLDIPFKAYRLPPGTLARMAIDRWARRSPAAVVADAVAHARHHHTQPHRARRDMGIAGTTTS